MTIVEGMPSPHIKVKILPSKYENSVRAIGVLDTGARKTMMNPDILPLKAWRTHHEYFHAADGQTFHTSLITKKLGIELFLDYIIWMKVIGSKLHRHDLLMGFS